TAGGGSLNSIGFGLGWNAGVIRLDSVKPASFGTVTPDFTNLSIGAAGITVVSATATTVSVPLATAWFTAIGSGGTHGLINPGGATNPLGYIANGALVGFVQEVCIAPTGRYGDTDGDGTVTIIDAQQIARSVVGLSVVNAAALAANGDVSNDGTVNIVDALG